MPILPPKESTAYVRGATSYEPAGTIRTPALPPLPDRAYYLREIDALLAGETDQQIVDALLDRRLDLMDRNS